MENEQITIALTVAQWQALLDALGNAPYVVVNSVGTIVADIQAQAAPQISEIQENSAAAETAEESSEQTSD